MLIALGAVVFLAPILWVVALPDVLGYPPPDVGPYRLRTFVLVTISGLGATAAAIGAVIVLLRRDGPRRRSDHDRPRHRPPVRPAMKRPALADLATRRAGAALTVLGATIVLGIMGPLAWWPALRGQPPPILELAPWVRLVLNGIAQCGALVSLIGVALLVRASVRRGEG